MGIKFYCPNGHKLNVKSFLSGQRAICPKCGARLVVPTADEEATVGESRSTSAAASSQASADEDVGDIAAHISLAETDVALQPASAPTPPALAAAPLDAISEAPSADWYVRPATGGQFGPAAGDVMRTWLNEGRVGASSLVWRHGWSEWRAAATVFPQLAGILSMPGGGISQPTGPPPIQQGVTPLANGPPRIGGSLPQGHVVQNTPHSEALVPQDGSSSQPLAQVALRRRRQHDQRLYISVVLVVATIILSAILIVVFQRKNLPVEPTSEEASPPVEVSEE